ncbi:type I-C CRISPR-associated protein Cas8c/Csd1 [Deinococcus sp. ME38]|uniref:type I-C CRISPR-associated protein Cas8c/Csd1 n=1 Tax=Deinococcus sp. ME38 TaxID=3400344 RepID=UPI003B5AAD90
MIRDLVTLAGRLPEGTLPPPGYYLFSEKDPVRVEVHLYRDGRLSVRAHVGADAPHLPLPENGRTSGSNARLIADRAKVVRPSPHVLHADYREQLRRALDGPHLQDPEVRLAVTDLLAAAQDGRLDAALTPVAPGERDWVSFTATIGGVRQHLVAHPDVQRAWMTLLGEDLAATTPGGAARQGECAACGQWRTLAKRSAVKIALNPAELAPLTSRNQSAYLSGETDTDRASIALCLPCTDTATRTLNWLLRTAPHHQYLHVAHKGGQGDTGSSRTLRAVSWLSGAQAPGDLPDLLAFITGPDDQQGGAPPLALPPSAADLQRLWDIPGRRAAPDAVSSLGAQDFHLLLLSPIKGHIIVRNHHTLTLGGLVDALHAYQGRVAQPVLGETGPPRLASQRDMVDAALRQRTGARVAREDPHAGLIRAGLLRHAYLGSPPPQGLLLPALHAFHAALRHPDSSLRARLHLHALACALTLYRSDMDTAATLAGRLLAVIERLQQDSQRRQYGRANDHTVATRTITAAAARPSHILGQLIPLATRAYLPRARHHQGRFAELSSALLELGLPERLTPHQQAEFSLGYYAELHALSARRAPTNPAPAEPTPQEDPV